MLGAMSLAYFGLSIFYFYADWFCHLRSGSPMVIDPSGIAIPAVEAGRYAWTVLSPWRIPMAGLSVALLAFSAVSLWRGTPRSRAIAIASLWGVLLPQVFWYTELAVDWYAGQVVTILLCGLTAVLVPTALLYEGRTTLGEWGVKAGAGRLMATAVALGWIGFLATEMCDHSYQVDSTLAYAAAFTAIPLAALAMTGIVRLRAWSLWVGVGAALALALVPLAVSDSSYLRSGGYIDAFVFETAGSPGRALLWAIFPATVIWALAAPFLHAFVKRCVNDLEPL